MDFIFDLLILAFFGQGDILAFFGRGELLVCHSKLCCLVLGSYSKMHNSSPVMTCLKKFSSFFYVFKNVQTHIRSVFLLFVGEIFWDQLCTNFRHAQFQGQNVMDSLVIQIQLTANHSDCQTLIRPHESPHFGHIFIRF